MPRVSVVVPTYNRADVLPSAIRSVMDQAFRDWEIIIVDDCSHDNTAEVAGAFADPRIRYVRLEQNRGTSGAKNAGIGEARGELIAFLDSDDEWLPDKLRRQVEMFNRADEVLGLVYTDYLSIDRETGEILHRRNPAQRGHLFNAMLTTNAVSCPLSCWCVRRACFKRVGLFDEALPRGEGEDYDFSIRLSRHYLIDFVAEPLVKYYIHKGQLSTNYTARIDAHRRIMEKISLTLADLPGYSRDRILSNHEWYVGTLYCHGRDMANGRRQFARAIRLNPFEPKYYAYLACSTLGSGFWEHLTILKRRRVTRAAQASLGRHGDRSASGAF